MSPGVTYRPETSTVFNASAGLSFSPTAAILPAAIATSRTALILLRASTTCPPRRRRSYFAGAAGACSAERDRGTGTRDREKGTRTTDKAPRPTHASTRFFMRQLLLALVRRVAVHVAPRYSPISSAPPI